MERDRPSQRRFFGIIVASFDFNSVGSNDIIAVGVDDAVKDKHEDTSTRLFRFSGGYRMEPSRAMPHDPHYRISVLRHVR